MFSWGDSRIGNMLYRDFTPGGRARLGDGGPGPREMDLAWMIFLHQFFEDLTSKMGLPGMPHFMRVDDVAASYEAATGHPPRPRLLPAYAAIRHGIVMSRVTGPVHPLRRGRDARRSRPPDVHHAHLRGCSTASTGSAAPRPPSARLGLACLAHALDIELGDAPVAAGEVEAQRVSRGPRTVSRAVGNFLLPASNPVGTVYGTLAVGILFAAESTEPNPAFGTSRR